MNKRVLVTGAAGFIGFHLSKRLLDEGSRVVGIDNLNAYYDVNLKKARLAILKKYDNFTFHKLNISNRRAMEGLFRVHQKLRPFLSRVTRHASRILSIPLFTSPPRQVYVTPSPILMPISKVTSQALSTFLRAAGTTK